MSGSGFPVHDEVAVHACCMDGRHTLKHHRHQVEQTYTDNGVFLLTTAGGILAVLLSSEGEKLLKDLEIAASINPKIKVEGHAHNNCAWLKTYWPQLQQAGCIDSKLAYGNLTLDQEHELLRDLVHQARRVVEDRLSRFPYTEFIPGVVNTETGQYLQDQPAMAR